MNGMYYFFMTEWFGDKSGNKTAAHVLLHHTVVPVEVARNENHWRSAGCIEAYLFGKLYAFDIA